MEIRRSVNHLLHRQIHEKTFLNDFLLLLSLLLFLPVHTAALRAMFIHLCSIITQYLD